MESLLSLNPNDRPTAKQVLENKYFENVPDETQKFAFCVDQLISKLREDFS